MTRILDADERRVDRLPSTTITSFVLDALLEECKSTSVKGCDQMRFYAQEGMKQRFRTLFYPFVHHGIVYLFMTVYLVTLLYQIKDRLLIERLFIHFPHPLCATESPLLDRLRVWRASFSGWRATAIRQN